jgi:hypothetical protein
VGLRRLSEGGERADVGDVQGECGCASAASAELIDHLTGGGLLGPVGDGNVDAGGGER